MLRLPVLALTVDVLCMSLSQTALALAVAEEALAFEHRDLHWGNIMLSPPHDTHVTARLNGCNIRVRAKGAR
jgi:serine/threonine-protein kinase haspin